MYLIYKITLSGSRKIYIGMTKNIKNRMKTHRSREFRGRNFSYMIIEKIQTLEEALIRESYWTIKLKSNNPQVGYNKNIGNFPNPESKSAMSLSQSKRIDRPFLGKKHTMETRLRMSAMKKGKIPSISGHNSRPVLNISTGKKFDSILSAAKFYQLHSSSIQKTCMKKQKHSGGYKWEFLKN